MQAQGFPAETLSAWLAPESEALLKALDAMAENVVGAMKLPLCLLPGLCINGRRHAIPMVTEEPSVVAGANRAAKLFNTCGGIVAEGHRNVTSAQLHYIIHQELADPCAHWMMQHKSQWLALANDADPCLLAAGGGAFDLSFDIYPPSEHDPCRETFLVLRLDVATVSAMGANAVNTMAEALKRGLTPALQAAFSQDTDNITAGMAIVTNAAPQRITRARIRLPFQHLKHTTQIDPAELSRRIELASAFASRVPDRAVTHNKGIMNGVVAVGLALGQDTRAIEASASHHANASGHHRPLSQWLCQDESLIGTLEMPIVAGTVGGTRKKHPGVDAAFAIAQIDDYDTLCAILAGIGLAQNFAALSALTTDGIQAGHMRLHQRK